MVAKRNGDKIFHRLGKKEKERGGKGKEEGEEFGKGKKWRGDRQRKEQIGVIAGK